MITDPLSSDPFQAKRLPGSARAGDRSARREPETYHYPKDPEFLKKYGPRGVIRSYADGRIEDTGPLTRKRMETSRSLRATSQLGSGSFRIGL